jgi:hypothetical protein
LKGQKQNWVVTVKGREVLVTTENHNTSYMAREKAFSKIGAEPTADYSVKDITEAEAAAWELEHPDA